MKIVEYKSNLLTHEKNDIVISVNFSELHFDGSEIQRPD